MYDNMNIEDLLDQSLLVFVMALSVQGYVFVQGLNSFFGFPFPQTFSCICLFQQFQNESNFVEKKEKSQNFGYFLMQ